MVLRVDLRALRISSLLLLCVVDIIVGAGVALEV